MTRFFPPAWSCRRRPARMPRGRGDASCRTPDAFLPRPQLPCAEEALGIEAERADLQLCEDVLGALRELIGLVCRRGIRLEIGRCAEQESVDAARSRELHVVADLLEDEDRL